MKLVIEQDEKDDILSKYKDNTSNEVLTHLRRHYPIYNQTFLDKNYVFLNVDGKNYFVDGHKKFLVNKLYLYVSESFPNLDKDIVRRTIKKYIDMILSTK
jgi:mRNA-degrading endonuclease HigB of HigAB toxin-antitoxin module